MNPETLQKVEIAVFSAVFGWVVAQLTVTVRTWLYRRNIIRLLHEELSDLNKEADRVLFYHARNLQLYGAEGIGNTCIVGISNPIYSNYYKDALLSLNQNQRISLQMIHGLVESQNEILKEIDDITSVAERDILENGVNEETVRAGELLGKITKQGYSNCAIIKWHIDFHLKRKFNPDMSPETEDHENYLKYLDSITKEMDKTIESGKTVPKEKFEKIYDESRFRHNP